MRRAVLAILFIFGAHPAGADPLNSPLWPEIRAQVLGDGPVVFDDAVVVEAPAKAENSMVVPVTVRGDGIKDAREIVLFADYNPIPKILVFHPVAARTFIATRFKVDMATPVRAAIRDAAGLWHVGGVWVDAAGGGCTQPSAASASPAWQTRLGESHARAWPAENGRSRIKLRVLHPMDTGLAGNIPAFYLADTRISDSSGRTLARIETFEPVSENPVLTMEVDGRAFDGFAIDGRAFDGFAVDGRAFDGFAMEARDSDGNEFKARISDGGPRR